MEESDHNDNLELCISNNVFLVSAEEKGSSQ